MKKGWLILLVILVVIVGFFLLGHTNSSNENNESNLSPKAISSQTASLEECDIGFSEYLVDPKYVQKIGQIGVVHGFGKVIVERSYISTKEEFVGEKIPIYAPTDMKLVSGARYKMSGASENYIPDYVLKFELGCEVELVLGHLKDVVPEIAEQISEVKEDSREEMIKPIDFKAGDLIAYYIQQEQGVGVSGFDFIVRDRKITNKFLNQARYDAGQSYNLRSGVCPYDFYEGPKKEAYYNLFGGGSGTIFKVKDCGSASRDVAGTISGMWFLDKEIVGTIYDYYMDGEYGSPISIVGDEERIAIGNLGQKSAVIYIGSNNPTYKLPKEITSEHCYQLYTQLGSSNVDGYIYFEVIDDMTIDVYYSASGSCPSSMPQGARRYYK